MSTVQILLGGTDVTAKVLYATARFQSKVNGAPGQGYMRVRDDDSTFDFTIGADWLVLVDGDAAWRGFAMQKKRVYLAPAEDVTVSGLQRFVDVAGPDGNILFTRRVVFDESSPANVTGTQFPPATADTTALSDLLANWLDFSADSIDTSSGVTHVGDLDPAQATRAWSGGWEWNQAMDSIGMLPGAVYYLRPESGSPYYTLVYCDVDTPTSPFGLSDTPNHSTTMGYREMELIKDGTGLVTDELAWGLGYGSQVPVFKRVTDATAVSTHGVWQDGRPTPGVYKQTTIDRIANSVVYGSPSNHRGAKDDRTAVELVTYQPGLLAGHVVPFTSNIFGFSDTIPVRQLDLTFDAPTTPKWKLLLSHAIDAPWGFYDQFWPNIPTWPLPCLVPPCYTIPPPTNPVCDCTDPSTGHDRCADPQFDDFNRTVASGWGTATPSGKVWTMHPLGGAAISVDGSSGIIRNPESNLGSIMTVRTPMGPSDFTMTMRVTFDATDTIDFALGIAAMLVDWSVSTSPGLGSGAGNITVNSTTEVEFTSAAAQAYLLEWAYTDSTHLSEIRVWADGSTRPSTPTVSDSSQGFSGTGFDGFTDELDVYLENRFTGVSSAGAVIDWIDFVYAGRPCYFSTDCSSTGGVYAPIDDFNRTDPTDWGTASCGRVWSSGGGTASVAGGSGTLTSGFHANASQDLLLASFGTARKMTLPFFLRFTVSAATNGLQSSWSGASISIGDGGTWGTSYNLFTDSGSPGSFYSALSTSNSGGLFSGDQTGAVAGPGTYTFDCTVDGVSLNGATRMPWRDAGGVQQPSIPSYIQFGAISVANAGGSSISIDLIEAKDMTYWGTFCSIVPVDPTASGGTASPTGWGCEVPTRTSSTVYATAAQFTAGSVLAWRAGLFQRPGTDFTEDSGLQSITFADAVGSSEEVRVCYLALATA